MTYISKISDDEAAWKYPMPPLLREGYVNISEQPHHKMYYVEYGNPAGEPVMMLHGGPGGGHGAIDTRFCDPARYRIILFDQRGCGKSTPHVAQDPKAGLADNTTAHLIADIEKLRAHLGIVGTMHVFGGSWGSTLSLAYAMAHPAHVASLILRGIFLVRKADLDYFYQGNAATYATNPADVSLAGAYLHFPQEWKEFVGIIPPEKRGDMVAAYAEIFAAEPADEQGRAQQLAAVMAWTLWEGRTSYLAPPQDMGKFEEPDFAKAFARIENHYFMNGCFLGGKSGAAHRGNNYLLENVATIAHLPIRIVHGQYDQVCPRHGADALFAALKAAGAEDVQCRFTPAGHSRLEREMAAVLTEFMDNLPAIA